MKIYLVGGAVRDQLLKYPFEERDWVVVGASPEQMIEQGFKPVGKDFPVFLHPKTGEEYALARTERKTAPGYKGFIFHTDQSVTLEEDLKRRDLTINSIAQDNNGCLIDPYGGQHDIQRKILRHVSSAFLEDPVRILRVARFISRYHHLGFQIAKETSGLMCTMVKQGETRHLVAERVWQETYKALTEKSPEQFFISLRNCGALKDVFPELAEHLFNTSLINLQYVAQKTQNPELRFAALCYPLEVTLIEKLCKRLGIPNYCREPTILIRKHASDMQRMDKLSAVSITKLLQTIDASRKKERFQQTLNGINWILNQEQETDFITFWQTALYYFQQVDPQKLIAKGYTKAALGEAIAKERLLQVELFLKTDINTPI